MDSEIIIRVISEDEESGKNIIDQKKAKADKTDSKIAKVKSTKIENDTSNLDSIKAFCKAWSLSMVKQTKNTIVSYAIQTTDNYIAKRNIQNANALLDTGISVAQTIIAYSINPVLGFLHLTSDVINKATNFLNQNLQYNQNIANTNATIKFNNQRSGSETNL